MKTLREKLQPQYVEKLEIVKYEFPTSYDYIQKSLENNYVLELTIDDAMRIVRMLDVDSLDGIWNMFD